MAVIFLLLIAGVLFFSGGFENFFRTITGRATTGTTNLSISVAGALAVNITVFNSTINGSVNDPTEDSVTNINFTVQITDNDGFTDINVTSVRANFTASGEALRQNSSCTPITGNSTAISQNFSCTIQMWYFDGPKTWNITVMATDLGNLTQIQNTSTVFTYDALTAMRMAPAALSWPTVSPGQTNQTSNNDPTLINNTGNYNITNVTVTPYNLMGQVDNAYSIVVGNLTLSNSSGGSPPLECNGIALLNATQRQIAGAVLLRGNNTVNAGDETSGQEQLYFCIKTVPTGIPSQSYSTPNGGAWIVTVVQ
jgi:hypothetical protein